MRCWSCSPRGTRHTPRGPHWQCPVTRLPPLLALRSQHRSPRGQGHRAPLPTRGLLRPACSVLGVNRALGMAVGCKLVPVYASAWGRELATSCPPGPQDPPAAGSCKLSPAGNQLRLPVEVCFSSSSEVCAMKYLVRTGCPSPFARGCGCCGVMPSSQSQPLCAGQVVGPGVGWGPDPAP